MSAQLPVLRNGPGDPTPRTLVSLPDRGPTVIRLPCEELHDAPQCYGSAHRGPRHCTCDLPALDHFWCEREARRQLEARDYQPCEDCAFRKGSPEAESGDLRALVDGVVPFLCHRGMPAFYVDGKLERYAPRDPAIHGAPRAYPVCMGWLRATLGRGEGAV